MAEVRSRAYRFGDFQLDVSAYELRRHGSAVRVERRPMELLIMLVERRGELVTRDEIVDRLWGPDVFIDVDASVNTVIRKFVALSAMTRTTHGSSRPSRERVIGSSPRSNRPA